MLKAQICLISLILSLILLVFPMDYKQAMGCKQEGKVSEELTVVYPQDGYYLCRGSYDDKDNIHFYEMVMTIQKKKNVYEFHWLSGGQHGIGRLTDNILSVSWLQQEEKTPSIGLTQYKWDSKDKVWSGEYVTIPGDGLPHPETLRFLTSFGKKGKVARNIDNE